MWCRKEKGTEVTGEELSSFLATVPAPEHLPQAAVPPSAAQAGALEG